MVGLGSALFIPDVALTATERLGKSNNFAPPLRLGPPGRKSRAERHPPPSKPTQLEEAAAGNCGLEPFPAPPQNPPQRAPLERQRRAAAHFPPLSNPSLLLFTAAPGGSNLTSHPNHPATPLPPTLGGQLYISTDKKQPRRRAIFDARRTSGDEGQSWRILGRAK